MVVKKNALLFVCILLFSGIASSLVEPEIIDFNVPDEISTGEEGKVVALIQNIGNLGEISLSVSSSGPISFSPKVINKALDEDERARYEFDFSSGFTPGYYNVNISVCGSSQFFQTTCDEKTKIVHLVDTDTEEKEKPGTNTKIITYVLIFILGIILLYVFFAQKNK